jgi:hypothetical protein
VAIDCSELILIDENDEEIGMESTADAMPGALGVAEAARFLGISHYKITKFIKLGIIKVHKDLNDERHKLIKTTDLERLKKQLESPLGDEEKESKVSEAV